ncbi:phage tail protein [Pelomyxa schiedti]|nr:phage tail protein [Pelomyxa schiedti]
MSFRLVLVDANAELCEALRRSFATFSEVAVIQSLFENVSEEWTCIVSPGNSFGLMDGGMDLCLTSYFGEGLQTAVQSHIVENFDGEQPVGTAFVVETGNSKHPYLVHAPTMRVPESIQVGNVFKIKTPHSQETQNQIKACLSIKLFKQKGTDNVYLAMKAVLHAVKKYNAAYTATAPPSSVACTASSVRPEIRTLLCPGLGTCYGKMDFNAAATQMALAYNNFIHAPSLGTPLTWSYATRRNNAVKLSLQGKLNLHDYTTATADNDIVEKYLLSVTPKNPDDIIKAKALYEQGAQLESEGKLDQAISLYKAAFRLDPRLEFSC